MSKRKEFRLLIDAPGMVLAPGAYDALSARIIEATGFSVVVGGGYAGIGSMLGEPDIGQSNMRDYADHYGRLCDAVSVPVYVDGDTGFGGVHNVRQMVRMFEKAGVSGLFIGDQVFPNRCGYMAGIEVISTAEMVGKLKAALDARTDPDLFIGARTDALKTDGLEAAIERCQIYKEVGVDIAKPVGTDDIENYKRVRREVPGPQFANISHANAKGSASIDAYEEAGAELATFPSAVLFAATGAVSRTLQALKRDRSFDAVKAELCSLEDYYGFVGFEKLRRSEDDYAKAAEDLLRTKI